jgi:hypothetical protein
MDYTITFTNKRVWDFYNEKKHLNIEQMNILMIEILEKIFQGTDANMDTNTISCLLDNVKSIQSQMTNMNEKIGSFQQDTNNIFSLRLNTLKHEYMEDLKMILNNNTNEKIEQIIEKNNLILQDKTKLFLTELIPKNQETLFKDIQSIIQNLQQSISNDTTTLIKSGITKDILDNFIATIEGRFNTMIGNSQNTVNTIISSCENRIQNKINDTDTKILEIKDLTNTNNGFSQQLQTNISDLLKKMENVSTKGRISENLLYNIILGLFPSANIEYVGGTKETGDIILHRKNKPSILLENKDYSKNVNQEEINKFYRDIDTQKICGIMLSQKTGIVYKENFEIEIRNNQNIVLFIHNVEYNADKIRVAIEIIDYLKNTMTEYIKDENENITIDKPILDEINNEFRDFAVNKLNHLKTIKDFHQRLLTETETLKLPSLEGFLSKKYENSLTDNSICKYCNYYAKNPRALSAHLRGCKTYLNSMQNLQLRIENNI